MWAEVLVGVVSTNPGHDRLLRVIVAGRKGGMEDGGTEIRLTRHRRLVEPRCRQVVVCCGGRENVVVIRPVWEIQ